MIICILNVDVYDVDVNLGCITAIWMFMWIIVKLLDLGGMFQLFHLI